MPVYRFPILVPEVLPALLARIGRKFPDICLHLVNGPTSETHPSARMCHAEPWLHPTGREHRLAALLLDCHERYLLAVPVGNPPASTNEVTIEDLKGGEDYRL